MREGKEISTASENAAKSANRLSYLDWLRGLAAVVMLQGHVFHSFTGKEWRESGLYALTQFVGGMPPAAFLFLTGVTMAFLMDSSERRGVAPWDRWKTALRRAGYLLGLAYVFRFQLWLFGQPSSPWTDLLKVDVLNLMGLGLAAVSVMVAFSTAERARLGAVLGLAIAAASPLVSAIDWTGVPTPIRTYLAPDYNYFSFFPWGAFLGFGLSAGSLLRLVKAEHTERLMQWLALGGLGLIAGAHYFSSIPYSIYTKSTFWLDSPAQILIKLGVLLVALPMAWAWNTYVIRDRWNWLRQLGTTSLLVYWVHIELVYGRWFWFWKENLPLAPTAVMAVFIIGLMVGVSMVQTRWSEIRTWYTSLRMRPLPGEAID